MMRMIPIISLVVTGASAATFPPSTSTYPSYIIRPFPSTSRFPSYAPQTFPPSRSHALSYSLSPQALRFLTAKFAVHQLQMAIPDSLSTITQSPTPFFRMFQAEQGPLLVIICNMMQELDSSTQRFAVPCQHLLEPFVGATNF